MGKNLIMDIVCIVWKCLQSQDVSSLSLSKEARDGKMSLQGLHYFNIKLAVNLMVMGSL